jgi:putative peptidoglycan lipid II flippase
MGKGGRQIAKAAVLVAALFVVSRVLGLVRQMVLGALFGTGGAFDAYVIASRIPEMIFMVIAGGALGSAFIPAFASHLAQDDHVGAWRLASAVINLTLIVLTTLAVLTALFAPQLVRTVLAPGSDPYHQMVTTRLLRIMLLSPIIFGVSGIIMGILNARQHFLMPALAPSLYNLAIIGGALYLTPSMGVDGLAISTVIGAALHLLAQLPALARHGARYVPTLGLRDPSVREVGRLMAPRVVGTAITQINFIVNNSLATLIGAGAASALNYAWLLVMLPHGMIAQAVATAAFPTFADQVARGQQGEMRATLAATLRMVFFLCLPATVGMVALARPLVGLLFERGAFEAASTEAVAWALALYALGLLGHAGLEIVARAFYALHDTLTPVWVGGLAIGLNVALSLTLPSAFEAQGWMPLGGLALANSIATLLETAVLLALIRRRVGGIEGRQTLIVFAKSGLAALAMGAALVGWQTALPGVGTLVLGGGGVLLGAAVYLVAALLLQTEELQAVGALFRR